MSLRRALILMLVAFFAVSAVTLYQVSQAVQHKERVLKAKELELTGMQEKQRLLKAEWSYLNRPDRLESLAQDHLNVEQVGIEKVTDGLDDVPEPMQPPLPQMRKQNDVDAQPVKFSEDEMKEGAL